MAHACNPSTLGGWGRWIMKSGVWDQPGQHSETPSLLKNTKMSQAWWCMPVVPATWEDEAGESIEPGRRKLQWAEITPLHSSLGNRVRLHLKNNNNYYYHCNYYNSLKSTLNSALKVHSLVTKPSLRLATLDLHLWNCFFLNDHFFVFPE